MGEKIAGNEKLSGAMIAEMGMEGVNPIGEATIAALFGGMASTASGGDFAEGALTAMVVYLYNDAMADYQQRNSTVTYKNGHKYYRLTQQRARELRTQKIVAASMRRRSQHKISYEKAYERVLDLERMNEKSGDVVGLGLSVASTVSPPGMAVRFGIAAIGVDALQNDRTGLALGVGAMSLSKYHWLPTTLDLAYGVYQVIK